jgi:hypothetical protein
MRPQPTPVTFIGMVAAHSGMPRTAPGSGWADRPERFIHDLTSDCAGPLSVAFSTNSTKNPFLVPVILHGSGPLGAGARAYTARGRRGSKPSEVGPNAIQNF